jgi:ATPase family associated with various cellular activities (AAA)
MNLSNILTRYTAGLFGLFYVKDVLLGMLLSICTCGRATPAKLTIEEINVLNPYRIGNSSCVLNTPIFGKWYFGWLSSDNEYQTLVWFLGDKPKINVFDKEVQYENASNCNTVSRWIITTPQSADGPRYSRCPRTKIDEFEMYEWQDELSSKILDESKNLVVLLTGQPGCGKSIFAEFLASKFLKQCSCRIVEFNPFGNNTSMMHYYAIRDGIDDKIGTMIFVLEEIDSILEKLMLPETHSHNVGYSQFVRGDGKSVWNSFLDELSRPIKDLRIITIMTSNRSKSQIEADVLKGDTSLLRDHRVHIVKELHAVKD